MEDMWKTREKPTALDFDGIKDGAFTIAKKGSPISADGVITNGAGGSAAVEKQLNGGASAATSSATLKDQRALTLQDNLQLFITR